MHRTLPTLTTITACLCSAGLSTAWLVSRIGRLDLEQANDEPLGLPVLPPR